MDYCAPRGIAYHGTFLAWSQYDQDAALAWQQRENGRCGGCGQITAEWMGTGADGKPEELDVPPYVIEPSFCPACAALDRNRRVVDYEAQPGLRPAFAVNEHFHAASQPEGGS